MKREKLVKAVEQAKATRQEDTTAVSEAFAVLHEAISAKSNKNKLKKNDKLLKICKKYGLDIEAEAVEKG